MTKDDTFDPRLAVYTPTQVATYGLGAAKETAQNVAGAVGIHLPIAELGAYVPPILPGQILSVIAQTSNYKSGFLHFVEHANALRLTEQGHSDHIIIHVSVEESIEEQAYLELAVTVFLQQLLLLTKF